MERGRENERRKRRRKKKMKSHNTQERPVNQSLHEVCPVDSILTSVLLGSSVSLCPLYR